MNLKKQFETPIHILVERPCKKGDVGIEIESEGPLNGLNPHHAWSLNVSSADKKPSFWTVKPDNSLRNGLEYVMKSPVPIDRLDEALDEWKKYTKDSIFREDSIRTSIHVHRNVLSLNVNQILAIIGGWWLLETPVVDTQGVNRRGNLFCLRLQDADYILTEVFNTLTRGLPFLDGGLQDNVKYGALNLAAIERYGSLEFRFLKGTNDVREMKRWSVFFHDLCTKLSNYGHINDLLMEVEAMGSVAWAKKILPEWVRGDISDDTLRHKIETNFSYVYALMYKVRDVQIPSPVLYAFPLTEEDDNVTGEEDGRMWIDEGIMDDIDY